MLFYDCEGELPLRCFFFSTLETSFDNKEHGYVEKERNREFSRGLRTPAQLSQLV